MTNGQPTTPAYPSTTRQLSDLAVMQMVKLSRRSWWLALYRDGHQLAEYDTLVKTVLTPLGLGRSSRWEDISKDGMCSLRLLCPNGEIGELWGEPHKFWQFKLGIRFVTRAHSQCQAHVIGVVDGPDGASQCYAWEPVPGRLVHFRDHISTAGRYHTSALAVEPQGLKL